MGSMIQSSSVGCELGQVDILGLPKSQVEHPTRNFMKIWRTAGNTRGVPSLLWCTPFILSYVLLILMKAKTSALRADSIKMSSARVFPNLTRDTEDGSVWNRQKCKILQACQFYKSCASGCQGPTKNQDSALPQHSKTTKLPDFFRNWPAATRIDLNAQSLSRFCCNEANLAQIFCVVAAVTTGRTLQIQ